MLEPFLSGVSSLHVPILLVTIVIIVYGDHQAWLYFTGQKKTLSARFTFWTHLCIWIGLGGMILSGLALVLPDWQFYVADPVFFIKMLFVLVLFVNAVAIGRLMPIAQNQPFAQLTLEQKKDIGSFRFSFWI